MVQWVSGQSFFTGAAVVDYKSAVTSDTVRFARYFSGMLERGIYMAPSQFEAAFVSGAHSDEDIRLTAQAAEEVISQLGQQ